MLAVLKLTNHLQAFRELLGLLTQHRRLTTAMARREIMDRYLGQVFGVFWVFGHPLLLIGVYVFIFAFVFKVKLNDTRALPLDYTTYILSGLIPWLSFQESMSKSSTIITSNANLVKQVIFPVEVLPVKGVLASLITQVIFLALLIIYVLIIHHTLLWTFLLLPVLVLLQTLAMIGVSYILAAVGVYFRDVKDFVQVFSVIGIYLMPAFYLPEFVPELVRPFLYMNPFSYLVWCYQDIIYFGGFVHWWAWPVVAVLSLGVFYLGYRIFRKLKLMFGNVL